MPSECPCDHCCGVAEPPTGPEPCGFPNPDVPGQYCGAFEQHEGEHGYWFSEFKGLDAPF